MRMCEGNHCGEQTNTQSKHLHLTADGAYFFNPEAKCTSIHAYQCVCHVCSAAVPSPSNVNYRNRIKKKKRANIYLWIKSGYCIRRLLCTPDGRYDATTNKPSWCLCYEFIDIAWIHFQLILIQFDGSAVRSFGRWFHVLLTCSRGTCVCEEGWWCDSWLKWSVFKRHRYEHLALDWYIKFRDSRCSHLNNTHTYSIHGSSFIDQ